MALGPGLAALLLALAGLLTACPASVASSISSGGGPSAPDTGAGPQPAQRSPQPRQLAYGQLQPPPPPDLDKTPPRRLPSSLADSSSSSGSSASSSSINSNNNNNNNYINNNNINNIISNNNNDDDSDYYDQEPTPQLPAPTGAGPTLTATALAEDFVLKHSAHSSQQQQQQHAQTFLSQRVPDKEYLSHHLAEQACRLDRGCLRKDRLNNTYLNYCTRYKLENLFSNKILMYIMHDSSDECERVLDEFIQLDELINQFDQLFKNLLLRYNCHNGYSVKWNCDDCKKAYKDWLCATSLPYYMNGERIKPCISFCERVEQRCPYLHPITKEQYGGQPVFICRDPNIPFVPEITPDIPYSEPAKCYDLCHLSENITELITDSLSKYEYDKCPDKDSIAEEVRSDPMYCRLEPDERLRLEEVEKTRTNAQPAIDSIGPGQFNDSAGLGESTKNTNSNSNNHEQAHDEALGPHVHIKKLDELRAVLALYKNQPKTHKFSHHSHKA